MHVFEWMNGGGGLAPNFVKQVEAFQKYSQSFSIINQSLSNSELKIIDF